MGLHCNFLSHDERTMANMLSAIMKQLVGRGAIREHLREAFQEEKMKPGGGGLRLLDLMGLLEIAIVSLPRVFTCTDIIDKCLPKCLPELPELLRNIVQETSNPRILLTGRPHWGKMMENISPPTSNRKVMEEVKNWREALPIHCRRTGRKTHNKPQAPSQEFSYSKKTDHQISTSAPARLSQKRWYSESPDDWTEDEEKEEETLYPWG